MKLVVFYITLLLTVTASAQKRLALVIGNSDYVSQSDLKNPVNDARLMKATFEKLGFKVHYHANATSTQMKEGIRKFHADLTPGCITAIFFSGHGAQVDDRNYILPVDLKAQFKYEVKQTSPSLKDLLSVMENAKTGLNLVFLDCCRNVPNLMTKERSGSQGLGEFRTESDSTLVSYATKHGMVAYDDPNSNNSLYTATLSRELLQPGIVIEEALRRVAKTVYLKSGKTQRPWMYGNLLDPLYLVSKTGKPTTVITPQAQPQPQRPATTSFTDVGKVVSERIRKARSTAPSQFYVGQFGEIQAAVSLQWLDELDAVRGSIFPLSAQKSLDSEWQFIGTNRVQGEIEVQIYDGNKKLATGSLRKVREGDHLFWVGMTSAGDEIRINREIIRKPSKVFTSRYSGKIGNSSVEVTLNYGRDRRITGSYKSLSSGKTYQLAGDNAFKGFIYLDEFIAGNLSARILLEKAVVAGKVTWQGKIFNPDGRINPVVISKK